MDEIEQSMLYIYMEDGRIYVKLHKFHIQAKKELLGANDISLHKIKPLQVISSYQEHEGAKGLLSYNSNKIDTM